jgi:inhibitor of cysteine peptidase
MLRRLCVVAVLLTAMSLLAGCCGTGEVKLAAEDNGSQVELQRGQTLVITLDSNPTTGYRWEVVASDSPVLRQKGEAEYKAPESSAVGAGGQEVFRFEAASAGEMTLELAYRRSWEDEEPAERFSVHVIVR